MAENINALILPIGADVSTFKKSINDVKAAYKDLSTLISSTPFNVVTSEQKTLLSQYGETIKTLTSDVKAFGKAAGPAANSIAGITLKIQELTAQKINLDATTSSVQIANLTKEIEKLTAKRNSINELGKSVAAIAPQVIIPTNSIAGLTKKIAELSAKKINLDASTSIKEIELLSRRIENLVQLKNKIAGVGSTSKTSFDQISSSAKDARMASTSLNLVLQDLPFGFIGIQNNLPALFSSFRALREETKSTSGAFSALIDNLKGPAGLFLAFTAVTTIITLVVQRYGSLANAYDKLFTSTSNATIAQREYNEELKEGGKNLGSELSKVELLTKGITNENSTREERLNYFYQAKKEIPSLLAGLNEENVLTAKGIKILLANSAARKSFLDLQVKQQAIGKVLNTNYSEEADIQAKLLEQENKRDRAVTALTESQNKLKNTTDPKLQKDLNLVIKQSQKEFDFAAAKISKYNEQLNLLRITQSDYSDDLDGIIKGSGEYEKNQSRLIEGLRKEEEAAKKAAQAQIELGKVRAKGDPIGTITEGVQINNGVITSDIGALIKVIQANVRLTNASVDQMVRYRDSKLKQPTPLDLAPNKLSKTAAMPMSKELEMQIGATKLMLEETAQNFATAKEALTDVFFNPLTDLFNNFTENGKNAFKEFGKAILATIKQLVAKIIATGIINLLASILVPGGPQAASLLGAAGGGSKIGQAFGSAIKSVLGIKSIANPSFAGVGGGGMQMNGQVVFTQRGSDLVGVLNRTNGTINRVG